MTDKTEGINQIAGESFIELNTEDAQKLGVEDGEMGFHSSRRGTIQAKATVSYKTNPGECWMPFHYIEGGANVADKRCTGFHLKYTRVQSMYG